MNKENAIKLIEVRDKLMETQFFIDGLSKGENDVLGNCSDDIVNVLLDELDIPEESDEFTRDCFYMGLINGGTPRERYEEILKIKEMTNFEN